MSVATLPLVVAVEAPRLSRRLSALREMLPPGRVVDVGAGHGALSARLALDGREVIATEATAPALAELRGNLARWGLADAVGTRAGDGLGPVAPGEVEGAVVAGMGGHRIVAIAAAAPSRRLRWVAIQCVQRTAAVESWLRAAEGSGGWRTLEMRTVPDRGRLYPTWILEPAR